MIKHRLLREALEAALPQFKTNPDMLAMFIDRAAVVHWGGANLAFRQDYTLNLVVTGWTGNTAALILPILIWLARHQPDLIAGGRPAFTFEADIIDAASADISIELALSEAMQVLPRTDGGFDLIPEGADDPGFDSALVDPAALLKQLWNGAERILPDPAEETAP